MESTFKDILLNGPKFEENILKAFENRKVVFFIGAGVSRIMGIKGWDEFSVSLIKSAFPEYKDHRTILRDIPNSKERITIAYKKFEEEGKLNEFYKHFGKGLTPDKSIFQEKENIYEILSQFEAIFLTTNADNLFENVLGSELCHDDYDPNLIKDERFRRRSQLFYLHGHYTEGIDPVKNSLVFTAPQYVARYNDTKFIKFLKAVFEEEDNVIIFVGYGLNEFELIDYVVTKSGYTSSHSRRVYVLYAFCENEEIIYDAKKSYFDALNIGIIPYDIGKRGYDSLIDVLKKLYTNYCDNTIVPITDTISECITDFNEENYATIRRYLSNEKLAPTVEVQITQEIQKTQNHEWINKLFQDGLFDSKQIERKIVYRAWPLLELMVDWIRSDDARAQDAACIFLDKISSEQSNRISNENSPIAESIIKIIFALESAYICDRYINLLKRIGKYSTMYGLGLSNMRTLHRVSSWDNRFIRALFDWLFDGVEINSFGEEKVYSIKLFFKQFNSIDWATPISLLVFEYFRDLILSSIDTNKYNLFLYVNNIDNIHKNHQEYWKIVLNEINLAYDRLPQKEQNRLVVEAISQENEILKKLGIYLARKYHQNVSNVLEDSRLFNFSVLYHETYLLIKNHIEMGYILPELQKRLCDIISESKFGIDSYKSYSTADNSYFEQLILAKRLALLDLFPNDKSNKQKTDIIKRNIEPYDTVTIADQCDYVHSVKWENEIKISDYDFENIPEDMWAQKFKKICEDVDDDFSKSDCCRQFAQLILSQNEDRVDKVLPTLKELSPMLLNYVVAELSVYKEKLNSNTALIDMALDILGMAKRDTKENPLVQTVFHLLSTATIDNKDTVKKGLPIIEPWLKVNGENTRTFTGDHRIVDNLINSADFDKLGTLLNFYIARKKLFGDELKDDECSLLLEALDSDTNYNYIKYTLCFHYQNLKFISPKGARQIFQKIFGEDDIDAVALGLCTLNSGYLFREVLDKIRSEFLSDLRKIPDSCRGEVFSNSLYGYIVSAWYEGKISNEEMEAAYSNYDFAKYYLRALPRWAKKEKFNVETWLSTCWKSVKRYYESTDLTNLANLLLHFADDINEFSVSNLDMFIEAAAECTNKSFVYVNIEKLFPFFDVDRVKTDLLLRSVLLGCKLIDREDLEKVICKYREYGLNREGITLLNMLNENGAISRKEKEQLGKILQNDST